MDQPVSVYICDDVKNVIALHAELFDAEFGMQSVLAQLDAQANRLLGGQRSQHPGAVTHLKCWHPTLVGKSPRDIFAAELTLEAARVTLAREYGFADWADVEARGDVVPDPLFESAVDCLLAGDTDGLQQTLVDHNSLVHARSAFGHRATLLHYVGSNGVETRRQVVPTNLTEIASVLLDAGADVNATADMYGGATTLAMLTSSSHPVDAGVVSDVERILLTAGAR